MAEEDLIFGKNRHFFGGIEPSNMQLFSVSIENDIVKIKTRLPNDTVVNGQTLCTVAGAVIRRKETGYPTDEFDGDLVANIKESITFADTGASTTKTYYYAAFPYTTQGVYNRNKANRLVFNEPEPLAAFSATSVYNLVTYTATVKITVKLSTGIVGAVIRKSTTGYPVNETDGELFANVTSDGTYIDSDVVAGTAYYYSAFTYNSSGVYNRSEQNRVCVTPSKSNYIFGYDLDTNNSSPDDRVTYPSDVDNFGYEPAAMNYSTSEFNYGGWELAPGEKFMPRPCMLTNAGTVDHYLDPNDYTKKEDGTSSKVADTSFVGNAMMEWPKIYTKRWEDEDGIYHFRCADSPIGSEWDCWCNYDKNDNQIDHFYTAIYMASNISSVLRSISQQPNSVGLTGANEITYATANGDDWYTDVLADRLLIQDLLVMMAKSTDCQTAYGYGLCNSSSAIPTGTMNTKGMFWGSNGKTLGVKVFGMENFWGNIQHRVAGWVNRHRDKYQAIKITRGTHDGSVATDYHVRGEDYISIADSDPNYVSTGTSGGYINSMITTPYGRLPISSNGSSSTFEADMLSYSGQIYSYAFVGGSYSDDLLAGPFCTALTNPSSYQSSIVGTSLSCKPSASGLLD